jgi:GTPase SAR1 family protein
LFPENGVLSGKSISVKEIGGSKAVRPFWNNYYHNKHAVMFVVNAAASDQELQTSKCALSDVLSDQRLKDKPFLIVGTHSDVPGARDADQLQQYFSDIMMDKRWSARSCCAFNEEQVKSVLSDLIDLIIHQKN